MADFIFIQNKLNGKWVISAPRRSHRTNVGKKTDFCPFCPGNDIEEEVYRIPVISSQFSVVGSQSIGSSVNQTGQQKTDEPESENRQPKTDNRDDWQVRVVKNKFPFAPHHEVIIHSPDHTKNFDKLSLEQVELILQTYRQRYNFYKKGGAGLPAGRQVYIFHNFGHGAGASLDHPHTQLAVIPQGVKLDITPLDPSVYEMRNEKGEAGSGREKLENVSYPKSPPAGGSSIAHPTSHLNMNNAPKAEDILETDHFLIFCPANSEWPDEVWIAPKENGGGFGLIKDPEIKDLGFTLQRLIQIFDLRHGSNFSFNFYIAPLKNWYLRFIPREKIIGGFELGTGIIVNTQDPAETFEFIREHFWSPDEEKIRTHHQAKYRRKV